MAADSSGAIGEERRECTMVTALDGRVVSVDGDVRAFFNSSAAAMHGRDLYLFFEKERSQNKGSIDAVAPNVTIERDVMIRPRE
jgi:hypothetical protein